MNFDLFQFRKDRRLTQQKLAEMLCLPQSSVSAMESGRTKISIAVIEKLRQYYPNEEVNEYIIEDKINITNYHVKGSNNGYIRNEGGKLTNVIEQQREMLERRETRIADLETKVEKLQELILALTTENSDLKILLAKNSIDF